MSKFKKSQILMLSLLAGLLFVTPLIPSSLRPKYLYFIINLLIIALGAEAGLLSAFSKPLEDKKHAVPITNRPVMTTAPEASSPETKAAHDHASSETKGRVVEKSASERIITSFKVHKVKKCPSTPSLFFIGGGETEVEDTTEKHVHEEEEEEEDVGGLSGQELFTKAEMFIGNFYKQLKMQREESWKRIHGLYRTAF